MSSARPTTDPEVLFRARDGIYADDLLVAAVGYLDLFTWLSDNPSNIDLICDHFLIAERPADVMFTLLTAMGLVANRQGIFSVTDLAREYVTSNSPFNLGPYLSSLKDRPICQQMFEVLKSGKPAGWSGKQKQDQWARAMEKEPFAHRFTSAMDSRGAYLAPALADRLDCSEHRKLLDIAGGSGIYACALTAKNPQLTAAVLEKPPVDGIVQKALVDKGMSDRVSVRAGDMFDKLPEGYDIHLYSHVLHDWDTPAVRGLLERSYEALPPGGKVAVFDAHLNAEKTGPLAVAEYSVLLMFSTEGRCYSLGEMQTFLQAAGFAEIENREVTAFRSLITAVKGPV